MAQWDNAAHHARQARKNTVLPAQMSKGGDKGPYVSDMAAGEMYDMIASDRGPISPKDAGATNWHAVWNLAPVADGTAVGTLSDLSGSRTDANNDLVQATGTKQPLYKTGINGYNGKPCLRFDGSNDQMDGGCLKQGQSTIAIGAFFALMIVGRQYQTAGGDEAWWCGNFGPKALFVTTNMQFKATGDDTNNATITSVLKATTSTPVLVTLNCFGDHTAVLRINGEIEGRFAAPWGADLNVMNIGAFNNNAQPSHLDLFELVYFSQFTSQRTIAGVEKYLLQTYGL